MLDRIDICTESGAVTYEELQEKKGGESSAAIRRRIEDEEKFKKSGLKAVGYTLTVP